MGMGGAFIGVADDATAASWNPAGLVQLEKPEVSAVYSYFGRKQTYSSSTHPEMDGPNHMDAQGLNYASAVYPFVWLKRNMVVSINYQRLYEMEKKVNLNYTWNIGGDKLYDRVDFSQSGYLYALAPAIAVQLMPGLYAGMTLNFWDSALGRNGWESTYNSSARGTLAGNPVTMNLVEKSRVSFEGFNANLGLLWNFYGNFTLGAVFKTPFDGDVKKTTSTFQSQDWSTLPPPFNHFESRAGKIERLTMKMPASYGLGLSYRHSDAWTLALDLYRTEWSRFLIEDQARNRINPVDGRPISEGRLKDTVQVRLGTEYILMKGKNVIPLRFGLFYDPEPQKSALDDYYGLSLGLGFAREKFAVDAAYQYRFGRNVRGDMASIDGTRQDVEQHTLMTSIIYYF